MKALPLPPVERLHAIFIYDPHTGYLFHRVTRGAGKRGQRVGAANSRGHLLARIEYRNYLVHRIIWAMHMGEDPGESVIDHANGFPDDNRICNLRLANQSLNGLNTKLSKRNKSGFKGVYYDRSKRLWRASICNKYIGRYRTKEEAAEAYRKAAMELGGRFARIE